MSKVLRGASNAAGAKLKQPGAVCPRSEDPSPPTEASSTLALPREPDHHVVIVGGGFGGLAVAQELGSVSGIRVTVIDQRNHHLFQPLLYQVATAVLSPSEIAEPIRGILSRHRNIDVLMARVEGVAPDRRKVLLEKGETCDYYTLVLATGATHSYFGHPNGSKLHRV